MQSHLNNRSFKKRKVIFTQSQQKETAPGEKRRKGNTQRSSHGAWETEPQLVRTPERVSPYRPAEIPPEREILPSEVPRLRAKSSDPFANSLEDLIPEKGKDKERSRPRKQTKRSIVPNIPAPKSDRDSRHKKRQPLLKGADIVRTNIVERTFVTHMRVILSTRIWIVHALGNVVVPAQIHE